MVITSDGDGDGDGVLEGLSGVCADDVSGAGGERQAFVQAEGRATDVAHSAINKNGGRPRLCAVCINKTGMARCGCEAREVARVKLLSNHKRLVWLLA